jgi:hypothetical protein
MSYTDYHVEGPIALTGRAKHENSHRFAAAKVNANAAVGH